MGVLGEGVGVGVLGAGVDAGVLGVGAGVGADVGVLGAVEGVAPRRHPVFSWACSRTCSTARTTLYTRSW